MHYESLLSRTGTTSFDVFVSVENQEKEIVSCDVTFVALDEEGRPTPHGL